MHMSTSQPPFTLKGPTDVLILCCCHLEILYNDWIRSPLFSWTKSPKLWSRFCQSCTESSDMLLGPDIARTSARLFPSLLLYCRCLSKPCFQGCRFYVSSRILTAGWIAELCIFPDSSTWVWPSPTCFLSLGFHYTPNISTPLPFPHSHTPPMHLPVQTFFSLSSSISLEVHSALVYKEVSGDRVTSTAFFPPTNKTAMHISQPCHRAFLKFIARL